MRLNVFRQFLLEGSTENSPEEEVSSQTNRDDSKSQENSIFGNSLIGDHLYQ